MSQYPSYYPQNDQSNYYIPLSFGGTCSQGESLQFFDPALCGNLVSSDEFKQLYSELKSTAQPYRSAACIYMWLCILGCLLFIPGVLIPILTRNDILLCIGIPIPLILYLGFLFAAIRAYLKKQQSLVPVMEKYNKMGYHAKGLNWALEGNMIHLSILPLFQGVQNLTFQGHHHSVQQEANPTYQCQYPQNNGSNYYIPLVFGGTCSAGESPQFFDPELCGNRVSHHEFAAIYADLKATDQSFHKTITCYVLLGVLSIFLLVAGTLIPALTKKYVFFSVGIPVPILLYLACLFAALRAGNKKHRALESVLEKYNKLAYNAKGVHWALTGGRIHLSFSLECYNQGPQNQTYDNQYYHQLETQLPVHPNPFGQDKDFEITYHNANQKTLYPQLGRPLLN